MSIQEDYTIVHLFSAFSAKSWRPDAWEGYHVLWP